MTKVLIVLGERPQQMSALHQALHRLHDLGASISMVGDISAEELGLGPSVADIRLLPAEAAGPTLRRTPDQTPQPSPALWRRAWADPWVRRRVRMADVLVALDPTATETVREMAYRRPQADVCEGIEAAGRILAGRPVGPRSATRPPTEGVADRAGVIGRRVRRAAGAGARRSLEAMMAPAVLRSRVGGGLWRSAVSAPGLPDRIRSALAHRVHLRSVQAGRPDLAATTTALAMGRIDGRKSRADLLTREAAGELALGHVPVHLAEAVEAELTLADDALPEQPARASTSLHKALRLLFHRVVHFDQLSSPLVERPGEFLAALRTSPAARALTSPRGRAARPAPPPTDRPLRLLVMTNGNAHFLSEIRQRYAEAPEVELRYLHLADDEVAAPLTHQPSRIVNHLVTGRSEYGERVEEWLRPHLDWADTLFVDWCVAAAAMTTLVDPGDTRIMVRLHSFETFSLWPHLVDFSRVDDLIFVSSHLRDLTRRVVPALADEQAPTLHVLPNAMNLRSFARRKEPASRFTLGLIGNSAIAKDPRWAIEILRRLRAEDDRYRLLLVGSGLDPAASNSVCRYQQALSADLAELEPSGAVTRIGHVDDVAEVLASIGIIISSSVRESFHCALVEGAASGAVPVVRDWPFFAQGANGARTLFPPDWVVATPEEAAARIRRTTASEDTWRTEGAAAATYAVEAWDWSVVRQEYDELFLPHRQL